jgi:hypothetical protein
MAIFVNTTQPRKFLEGHEFVWCDAWIAFPETSVYTEQAGEMREG